MLEGVIRALLVDSGKIEVNEHFYPIETFSHLQGMYGISPLGKVYSVRTRKIMKPRINKPGKYLYISLGAADAKRTIAIHRLVALHFVANLDNKREVHHIDGNPLNNAYWNLKWVTGDENLEHHRMNINFQKAQRKAKKKN